MADNAAEAESARIHEDIVQVHGYLLEGLTLMRDAFEAASARYCLAYGTLLGAIRGSAMIPWDIDADAHLFVEDEGSALAELGRRVVGTRWELQTPDTPGYEYCFPRLAMRDVPHTVIRVDIFPLVAAPSTRWRRKLVYQAFRFLCKLHMLQKMDISQRTHYSARRVSLVRIGQATQRLVPSGLWNQLYRILLRRCQSLDSQWLLNPCGSYGDREFFPVEVFAGEREEQVNGVNFSVPEQAESYLSLVYGDYLSQPSEDARYEEIRFADEHYLRPLRRQGLLESDR